MTEIKPVLEPEAAEFCKATDTPPFLYQMPPAEGRKTVDEVQSGDVDKPEIDEEWITVEGGPTGSVKVRIVKPVGAGAAKLREAGVPVVQVRFGGTIHDFMMLNALRSSQAATAAIKLAQHTLREALR